MLRSSRSKKLHIYPFMADAEIYSQHFNKEKISTDGYTSGHPVYFAWKSWWKPLVRGRPEKSGSAMPRMSVSAGPYTSWSELLE